MNSDYGALVNGVLGALAGLLGTVLYVRRKFSSDTTEIAEDTSKRTQISRLEEEIARLTKTLQETASKADNLQAQRTVDAAKIAGQEVDIKHLIRERDRLRRDIKRAVKSLPDDVRDVLETDFAQLADVDERIDLK